MAKSKKQEYNFRQRKAAAHLQNNKAIKLMADFFASPIEARDSEMISSVF